MQAWMLDDEGCGSMLCKENGAGQAKSWAHACMRARSSARQGAAPINRVCTSDVGMIEVPTSSSTSSLLVGVETPAPVLLQEKRTQRGPVSPRRDHATRLRSEPIAGCQALTQQGHASSQLRSSCLKRRGCRPVARRRGAARARARQLKGCMCQHTTTPLKPTETAQEGSQSTPAERGPAVGLPKKAGSSHRGKLSSSCTLAVCMPAKLTLAQGMGLWGQCCSWAGAPLAAHRRLWHEGTLAARCLPPGIMRCRRLARPVTQERTHSSLPHSRHRQPPHRWQRRPPTTRQVPSPSSLGPHRQRPDRSLPASSPLPLFLLPHAPQAAARQKPVGQLREGHHVHTPQPSRDPRIARPPDVVAPAREQQQQQPPSQCCCDRQPWGPQSCPGEAPADVQR